MNDLPCLPLIQERFLNEVKDKDEEVKNCKYNPECQMYMFPQTWGSTSLGFPCVGEQVMTTAYTTVIIDNLTSWCGVFFGEILAYIIRNPNRIFYKDICEGKMASVFGMIKYMKKV